jgi:hypothetical protein
MLELEPCFSLNQRHIGCYQWKFSLSIEFYYNELLYKSSHEECFFSVDNFRCPFLLGDGSRCQSNIQMS